jgi:hypothetical protein
VVLALLGAGASGRAEQLPAPPVSPGSGIELGLRTPFADPPPDGACTVEVTIRNGSRRDGRWELVLGSRTGHGWTHRTRQSVAVAAGASRSVLVLGQMQPAYGGIELTVHGRGVDPQPVSACQSRWNFWSTRGHKLQPSQATALSRDLYGSGGGVNLLKDKLEEQGRLLTASSFAPADLPADARSYSGFALLFLRQDEWTGLRAEVREAIDDWVALGGQLWLMGPAASEVRRGFGRVSTRPLGGQGQLDWEHVASVAFAANIWRMGWDSTYTPWGLPGRLVSPEIPRVFLFVVVLVSSLLIGPLNLYWFARGRLRHRVYWTTPLIAALAAVALLAMILARDGTGGSGYRWTAVALLPDSHRAAVVQEQIARTGLLLDGRFQEKEPLRISPVFLTSEWRFRQVGLQAETVGSTQSGWFASRRVQAQYLETVRPTRARVQVRRGGVTEALSSIEGVLADLYFVDHDLSVWHASGVQPGVPAPLSRLPGGAPPARATKYDVWFASALQDAGPGGRELLTPLSNRPGYFYASAPRASGAIETLPAIRWTQQDLLYVGPVEEMP